MELVRLGFPAFPHKYSGSLLKNGCVKSSREGSRQHVCQGLGFWASIKLFLTYRDDIEVLDESDRTVGGHAQQAPFDEVGLRRGPRIHDIPKKYAHYRSGLRQTRCPA